MMTTSSVESAGGSPAAEPRRGVVVRVGRWRVWKRLAVLGSLGLPMSVSIAAHVALGLFLAFSAWTFRGEFRGGKARSEVVIALPAPPPAARDRNETGGSEPAPVARVDAPPPTLSGLTTREAAPPPMLRSVGAEVPAAGDLLKRQDDSGIGATFAGLGARQATRIVYVVDASGAMVSSLKFVLAEVERSVRSLSSGQKFQVVLFRDRPGAEGGLYEVFAPGGGRAKLVAATPQNKAELSRWLGTVAPLGKSNPLDGLKRGLEFDPDAIFLLSRSIRRSGAEGGVWGGRSAQETLAELDRLNPREARSGRRRVVVKAIQFLEEDPTGTMQMIGNEHGDGPGSYAVLTLQAIGAR